MLTPLRTPAASVLPVTEIFVVIGHQYGQEVIRPACPTAEIFCEIARTKTLTRQLVEQIKRLGYTVKVQRTEPETL